MLIIHNRRADLMRVLAILGCVAWISLDGASAIAQTTVAPTVAPAAAEQQAQPPEAAPPAPQTPPTPQTIQPQGQGGQWVNTPDSGWIWVPEAATTYGV